MGGFNNGDNPFNFNQNIFEQFNRNNKEEEIDEDEYVDFEEIEDDEEK